MVVGSNPADLFRWGNKGEDLTFAQDTSLSSQFVQPWKLRMMAQEAALKEVANGKLRRLLASDKSFNCNDVKISSTVLF